MYNYRFCLGTGDEIARGDPSATSPLQSPFWSRPQRCKPLLGWLHVNFTVTGMKPNTRVYAFFDGTNVNAEQTHTTITFILRG